MPAHKCILSFVLGLFIMATVQAKIPFPNGSSLINGEADNKYVMLSVKLIENVKAGKSTQDIQDQLAKVKPAVLADFLQSDAQKKAFWINLYNAYIQILLTEKPDLYKDRGEFFSDPKFRVAQKLLSFDDVEHGIIRSSELKLALGLVKNPFADEFEKRFRTEKTDSRIHFALNCGAKSCPLVAIYKASNYETKVDRVAQNFLQKVSEYKKEEKTVYTTTLFSWFRGDFGGSDGIIETLVKYNVIPANQKVDVKYTDYDWTLSLGNYYEGN
ncbi:MAG: DUF547 domain-containing protein [Vicingaceae bacterium]